MNNREKLQNLILNSIDSNALMNISDAATLSHFYPRGFTYFRLNKNELKQLYGELPTFNNVEITDARLFLASDRMAPALVLKLSDGKTMFLPINKTRFPPLYSLFKNAGSYYTMNARRGRKAENWAESLMSDKYGEKTDEFYGNLHDQIIKALIEFIKQKQISSVNIVDGGCGTGNLVKKLAAEMPKELTQAALTAKLKLFAFDISSKDIDFCRKQFNPKEGPSTKNLPCRFAVGDLTKTDKVIEQFSRVDQTIPHGDLTIADDAPIVTTLSGSLTRFVLSDGFAALQSLQSMIQSEKINCIIGGGLGDPLINHYIAKQVGFKLIPLLPEEQRTFPKTGKHTKFFAYERMSLTEILQNKIKKLNKHNELDLSLSAQPELILEALLKEINSNNLIIKNKISINLSFAHLNDKSIQLLKEFIKKVPQANLVMWHHEQTCLNKMTEDPELKEKFNIDQPPRLVTDDLYLMGSRRFFNTIPVKEIIGNLISLGKDKIEILFSAVGTDHTNQVFKLLQDQGVDLNITDVKGKTIAHYSVQVENLVGLEFLAQQAEIDWNKADADGQTPAHYAVDNPKALAILAPIKDIDWNKKNKYGETPVDLIFEKMITQFKEEVTTVLQLLAKNGVDLLTPAQATKNDNIIKMVNEMMKTQSNQESSIYAGSKSELFTRLSKEQNKETKPPQNLSAYKNK